MARPPVVCGRASQTRLTAPPALVVGKPPLSDATVTGAQQLGRDNTAVDMAEQEQTAAAAIALAVERIASGERLTAPLDRQEAFVVGWSWWAHSVWTSRAVESLRVVGLGHEAAPLIRTVVDHAASIMWLAKDPEKALAAHKWFEESKAYSISESAKKAGWNLNLDRPPKKPAAKAPPEVEYIRKPEELMAYIGDRDLYMAFAYESAVIHPSIRGARQYIPAGSEEPGLRGDPRGNGTPLRISARCLIPATEALGNLADDEELRTLSREMAALAFPRT